MALKKHRDDIKNFLKTYKKDNKVWAADLQQVEDLIAECKKEKKKDKRSNKDNDSSKSPMEQRPNKQKKKKSKIPIFGVPLAEVLASSANEDGIPLFLVSLIKFLNRPTGKKIHYCALITSVLDIEGIFRIPANTMKMEELQKQAKGCNNACGLCLINSDSGPEVDFLELPLSRDDPMLVAALLTKFLRELPEPLFTFQNYTCFISVHGFHVI